MFAKKLHKNREEVVSFCGRHNKVYVYGVGFVAHNMMDYLKEEEIAFEAFIVSDGHREASVVNGKKVYELNEITLGDTDGIILGVAVDKHIPIKEILMKKGVKEDHIFCQRIFGAEIDTGIVCDVLLDASLTDTISENGFFSSHTFLDDLGRKYDTDKSSTFHNFLNKYEFFFKQLKHKEINFLELGICNGASLRMWEEYFENATVYGVDIDPECMRYESGRRKVLIKDLSNMDNVKSLADLKPSIVIDDASHIWSHQIKALYYLFPTLPNGGIYVLEDLETSFGAYRNNYCSDCCINAYEICEWLARIVCGRETIKKEKVSAVIWDIKDELVYLASQMEMVTFIHGSCIMIKK